MIERMRRAVSLGDSFMPVDSSSQMIMAKRKTEMNGPFFLIKPGMGRFRLKPNL